MSSSSHPKLKSLVIHASQLVCVTRNGEKFLAGSKMDEIVIIEDGSMVISNDGKIIDIGTSKDILSKYERSKFSNIIDLELKQSIIPGLVDCHSHPIFAGDRVHEFAMKLKGATYLDIHKMGGGIGYTVECVRKSNEQELLKSFLQILDRMLSYGTILLEAKSGYGLNLETELKMLKVIEKANNIHHIDIVGNYCGGHSIHKKDSITVQDYTKDIINNQIPSIIKMKQKGMFQNIEMIDVFHEKGIFENKETYDILNCGQKNGLQINFHGDELHYNGSAELAGKLKARAVSHLECVSMDGIKSLSENKVAAVLLPTTAHILRIEYPPARKMINNNVIVALGSDFNPNAHCLSMPFVMNLACVSMRLSLNEALSAATINSAYALNKSHLYGSLEKGKFASFIIINHSNWQHLIYQLVDPPIAQVFQKGVCVWKAQNNKSGAKM